MSDRFLAAFTTICQKDIELWADNYLAEIERLSMPFAIHFDRCKDKDKRRFAEHRLCIGTHSQDNPEEEYAEWHKQYALNLVRQAGYEWGAIWDSDETWEEDAGWHMLKLTSMPEGIDQVVCWWVNLWGDRYHIRTDEHFKPRKRDKFYRLTGRKWEFIGPIVYGPYLIRRGERTQPVSVEIDLTCLNWGAMTEELRRLHKERWDSIYALHSPSGKNPYETWNAAFDPSIEPVIVKHNYFNEASI